jgi:flagellar biosynthetic protein FlhB
MADNKSEKPTAQRLRKAREEGNFLSSRGMLTAVQFIVFVWLSGVILPDWSLKLQQSMHLVLEEAFRPDLSPESWILLMRILLIHTLSPLLILGASMLGAAFAVNLAVSRLGFSFNKLVPTLKNLNPAAKLAALPMQNLKSLAEAAFLMGALIMLVNSFYQEQSQMIMRIPFQALPLTVSEIVSAIHGLLWKSAFLFVLFGSIDVAFQYQRYMKGLKMSKQEVKEEHKRSDGDPQIKMRIRRLRRELLRRQMMKQIPQATAVIVNPTHFAVAIRYDIESMASPMVVAKGKNWLALRIRQVATQNEVPIIENPPLARALYDAAEIGSAISPEFYKAIAEVLAYVYKLMGRKLPR